MPTIKFTGFQGIIPKLSPRLLPDGAGQIANNCKVSSGELHSYNHSVIEAGTESAAGSVSIYRANKDGETPKWLTWDTDVDVVRAPFDVSVEPRFYWTGDYEPKYGTFTNVPSTFYTLGVPTPQTALTLSHSGGTGSAETRFYVYTFMSALNEESGPSPASNLYTGKVDGTWAISAMDAVPANSGSGTATGSTFTNSGAVKHWLRVGELVTISAVDHEVLTLPTAASFTVAATITGATAWTRKTAWNTAGMTKRLYRTSGTAANLQLVAEGITTTTYNDTIVAANIPGDSLVTNGWAPPPVGLRGMRVTPSGSLVGFKDNLVCFSEPYQPHTWPEAYQLGCDYDVVAIDVAGQEVVAATTANPYVAIGNDPSVTTLSKINGVYPCLSKRSMCSDGAACLFSSRMGMVAVQGGSAQIVTVPWFTADEWADYYPGTMISEFAAGKLFIAYNDGAQRMLAFNLDVGQLTTMDVATDELYNDQASGVLYLSTPYGIEEFDAVEGVPLFVTYQTKEVVFPHPVNLGAAQVVFSTGISEEQLQTLLARQAATEAANAILIADGDLTGAWNSTAFNTIPFGGSTAFTMPPAPAYSALSFELYSKGVLVFSKTVHSTGGFKLPAGYRTDRVSVKVSGQCDINYIVLAETMNGLRAA